MPIKIKILLADDHKIFRDGLKPLLERQPDIEVVGEADDGLRTIEICRELKPDVIILDITMPGLNGIEVTKRITSDFPHTKIIILSMHSDRRFVLAALKSGASGYLLKESSFQELIDGIRCVMKGHIYLSSQLSSKIIKEFLRLAEQDGSTAFTVLSVREREVLQLLAEGQSNKEIAAKLNISVKTIETHRKNIMEKLNLFNIAELTKYAIREGLTPLE